MASRSRARVSGRKAVAAAASTPVAAMTVRAGAIPPRRGARKPAAARPAMPARVAAADSQAEVVTRDAVGKSSVAHARITAVLPDWKKTIAPNAGQSADEPDREKAHSARLRPSRNTMAHGRRPNRSASEPPIDQPGSPRPPATIIIVLTSAGDQPWSVIGTYAVNVNPAMS